MHGQPLTEQQRTILARLAAAPPGAAVTKDALLAAMYPGPDGGPISAETVLRVGVTRIRKKLGSKGAIAVEWGVGYRLGQVPPEALAAAMVDARELVPREAA